MEEAPVGQRPTTEEVIARLKDDGDFDTLRLKIVRTIKDNVELRNSIISEVKQSMALNKEGAETMKPRQLSDAIYQEVGKKVMGQISDEVWKVIRSEGMKDDIRGTVETVYNRMVPKVKEEDHRSSPAKATEASSAESLRDGNDPKMQHKGLQNGQRVHLPSDEELHRPAVADDMPPGFSIPVGSAGPADESPGSKTRADAAAAPVELAQGLETGGGAGDDMMPPGFDNGVEVVGSVGAGDGSAAAIDDDDDDLDVPPGFG